MLRRARRHTPAASFFGNGLVVAIRIETKSDNRKPFWPLALP